MQGVITAVKQLVCVHFDDGRDLQVNPHCLELIDAPTLFGNIHE
jgi:hypothetical protein